MNLRAALEVIRQIGSGEKPNLDGQSFLYGDDITFVSTVDEALSTIRNAPELSAEAKTAALKLVTNWHSPEAWGPLRSDEQRQLLTVVRDAVCAMWARSGQHQQDKNQAVPRQSTGRDSADYKTLVIAELLRHHCPDESWRGLSCWDAIKQKEVVKALKLDEKQKARVSEVIKSLFGGQKEYGQRCRRKSHELLRILRAAAGETVDATGAADRIDGIASSDQELKGLLLDRESS